MRYDPSSKFVYVGYGEGSLGIINATNNNILGNVPRFYLAVPHIANQESKIRVYQVGY